eukprot:5631835-Lingulodinium_polyedra.AAC.1
MGCEARYLGHHARGDPGHRAAAPPLFPPAPCSLWRAQANLGAGPRRRPRAWRKRTWHGRVPVRSLP